MTDRKTFTVTEEHLKLIRKFNVGWQDCETGAPEIDPKRPYGNSSVAVDVYEILDGHAIGDKELTKDERDKYLKLHRETENALQVVLATGQFKPGIYEADPYRKNWKEKSGTID
jgi:hypothetical protein